MVKIGDSPILETFHIAGGVDIIVKMVLGAFGSNIWHWQIHYTTVGPEWFYRILYQLVHMKDISTGIWFLEATQHWRSRSCSFD